MTKALEPPVGWMPSGMDLSVQSSLWTLAKNRASGVTATVREAVFDFRLGYIGTSVIALAFIMLGATVMHRAGESFSPEGAVFSIQLVDLYAATLGDGAGRSSWSPCSRRCSRRSWRSSTRSRVALPARSALSPPA